MIGSCLFQYSYSFKSGNNCCSVYMNKTFYGHTPNGNGLLNLDHSDTHIHNIDAKDAKLIMIVQLICDYHYQLYIFWHLHYEHV